MAQGFVNTQTAGYTNPNGPNCSAYCVVFSSGAALGPSWSSGSTITINGGVYTISSAIINTTGGTTVIALTTDPGIHTNVAYFYKNVYTGAGVSINGDSGTKESDGSTSTWTITGTGSGCSRTTAIVSCTSTTWSTTNSPAGSMVLAGQWVSLTGNASSLLNQTQLQVYSVSQNSTNGTITFPEMGYDVALSTGGTITYQPALAELNEFSDIDVENSTATGFLCLGCSKDSFNNITAVDAGQGGVFMHDMWLAANGSISPSYDVIKNPILRSPNTPDYALVVDAGSSGITISGAYMTAGSSGTYLNNAGAA